MSVDSKEIDLIIRAALQGGKTLDGVVKSINDIEKALEGQVDAAKKGEVALDELKSTLLALKAAQDQLKSQAGIIGQFEKLAAKIGESQKKVEATGDAYGKYKDKLDKAGTATEYQANKLTKLATAYERNKQTLASQQTEQSKLAEVLKESGIGLGDLATASDRARQSAAQLGISMVKVQSSIASYAENMRAARIAEKEAADETAFQRKLDEAAKLNKASEYIRFWTTALDQADAAEEQIKVNTSLREAADAAIAAARGYKTLGVASRDLSTGTASIRSVIDGIINPTEAARRTLAGLEGELNAVAEAVSAINGPVNDYKGQIRELTNIQVSLTRQANAVDAYSKQVSALRQARTAFSDARAKVIEYGEALKNSTGGNDSLMASLRTAQVEFQKAKATLETQLSATRALRDGMRNAGMSTNDMAATQERLTSAARTSTNAITQLKAAHEKYGDSVRDNSRVHDLFSSSGRTTLSMVQRIRGELLSLVAAWGGVYGAINGVSSVLDAYNSKQAIRNQLSIAAGTSEKAVGEAYSYVEGQADRLGISLNEAAQGYAKFSAGAKMAGASVNETRYIYEAFAEASRVMNLSTEKQGLVFKALTDIMSKGSIQAEELKGQLGDSLPGIFGISQRALQDKYPQLQKALQDGKVSAAELLTIAGELKKVVGDQLPTAVNSLSANQQRFNNEIFKFKNTIAESGFADEFATLVGKLTGFFKSDEGDRFAKTLAEGLTDVVKVLKWCIDNATTLGNVFEIFLGIVAIKAVVNLGASLIQLKAWIAEVTLAIGGATGAARLLTWTLGALGAFATGWQIGKILSDQFLEVRLAGIALVVGLNKAWAYIKFGAKVLWDEVPNIFLDGLSRLGNVFTLKVREMMGVMSSAARAVGKDDFADSIDRAVDSMILKTDRLGDATKELKAQLDQDLKDISAIGDSMVDDELLKKYGGNNPTKPRAKATGNPGASSLTGNNVDDKEAQKRLKLKEQLENELATLNAKIERQEQDSLQSRLNAIDITYQKLAKKIVKLGGADGAQMMSQLKDDVATLKLQETKKFNDALLKDQTEIQKKLEQIDAQAGRNSKTDLDKRLEAVKTSYEQTYRDIAEYRLKLFNNGMDTLPADAMQSTLDAGVVAIQNIERMKYYEESVNQILEERKAKLEVINVQKEAGVITAKQAYDMSAQAVSETQPKLDALTAKAIEYVTALREAAIVNGESTLSYDTLLAKLISAQESAKGLRTELLSAAQVNEMLANGAATAFQTMAESIWDAVSGTKSWTDALSNTADAFRKFAADFLMQIAQMILKQALLNALQSATKGSTGGVGGVIAGAVTALMKHDGGIVGQASQTRLANPAWFLNAPRYHGGGIPGLASDEYAAVLKKNEEVLTADSPRNILNGGASAGQQATAQQAIKVINMIDSGSVVSEGLSSQAGERAFFNFIRANKTGLKQILA